MTSILIQTVAEVKIEAPIRLVERSGAIFWTRDLILGLTDGSITRIVLFSDEELLFPGDRLAVAKPDATAVPLAQPTSTHPFVVGDYVRPKTEALAKDLNCNIGSCRVSKVHATAIEIEGWEGSWFLADQFTLSPPF